MSPTPSLSSLFVQLVHVISVTDSDTNQPACIHVVSYHRNIRRADPPVLRHHLRLPAPYTLPIEFTHNPVCIVELITVRPDFVDDIEFE